MIFEVGEARRPHPLEQLCGDASMVAQDDWGITCVILDGAGHGAKAHRVAARLERCARSLKARDPATYLQAFHCHARGGDGAVAGVLLIERSSGVTQYAGLGNTTATVFGSRRLQFVSADGLLGQRMRSAPVQSTQLSPGDIAVLHTDGIAAAFEPRELPALLVASAPYLASVILERYAKSYDDAACIVVRVLDDDHA